MGIGKSTAAVPPVTPVPAGKIRICHAGFPLCSHAGRAHDITGYLAEKHPDKFESWYYWQSGDGFYSFLQKKFEHVTFPEHLKGHDSSPFIWLEEGSDNRITPIGGRQHFVDWLLANHADVVNENADFKKKVTTGPSLGDAMHTGDKAPKSTAAGC